MTVIEALRDALQDPHPGTSQERVHTILAHRLGELTAGSRVRTTGYFNHSWAPDFVVTSGDQPERTVFLRFDVHHPSFADDLLYLAADAPMFLDLDAANPSGPAPRERREESETASDQAGVEFDLHSALATEDGLGVLVAEAPAIDRFESRINADHDLRTATQRIVLGGRGLVDAPAADAIASGWSNAKDAISDADPETLRTALNGVEAFLSRIASLDLETELRARWIASGQAAETFPGG